MNRFIGRLANAGFLILVIVFTGCQPQPAPPSPTATAVPTAQPASLIGRPVKDDLHPQVYFMSSDGHTHLIGGLPVFNALAFQLQDIVTIPGNQLRTYPSSMPLTRWLTSKSDHNLYFLDHGQRYKIDAHTLVSTGGSEFNVSLVPDSFLSSFPPETTLPNLDGINRIADEMQGPSTRASLWVNDTLWLARSTGGLTRWNSTSSEVKSFDEPASVEALTSVDQN